MKIVRCVQRPSVERLRSLFSMSAVGVLTWVNPPKPHPDLLGNVAGSPIPTRAGKVYHAVQIDGRKYRRSHLVFALSNGRWPIEQIDHIDGNSLNDRPSNLREATQTQNAWNHKRRAKRSDTPMGVRRIRSGKFVARIGVNKQQISLGTFDSMAEAQTVYQRARREHFGEFA